MPLPTDDDYEAVHDKYDDAIEELFDAVARETVPRGPFSKGVYDAAEKMVEAFQAKRKLEACEAMREVRFHRMTDLGEYQAELKWRCQIGLTIDPANAETTARLVDWSDPYDILDRGYHVGWQVREYFARRPGGDSGFTLVTCPKRRTTRSGSVMGTYW